MQTNFRRQDLDWAVAIADALLRRFQDVTDGGFFFTSHDHEALIHRPKPAHDNATPAGNGIAAQGLLTLGHWLGEPSYVATAERTLRAFAGELGERPAGVASLLIGLEDALAPASMVLLRGDSATCVSWQRRLERAYRPRVRVLDLSREADLPGALSRPHEGGAAEATAWVCTASACLPPIHSMETLEKALLS
jgi:hypothetical protein